MKKLRLAEEHITVALRQADSERRYPFYAGSLGVSEATFYSGDPRLTRLMHQHAIAAPARKTGAS